MVSIVWVLALYRSVLQAPFVYDDVSQILKNPWLGSFQSVLHFFRSSVSFTDNFLQHGQKFYRPIFWMSLALDRLLWGLDHPVGFHLTNLLLHSLDGALGYLFLRRLGIERLVSAGAVLMWLGLPINSEVVAWISGRSYSLMLCFVLLALLSGQRYVKGGHLGALVGLYFFSFLALLSNEEGVLVLPLGMLLACGTYRISPKISAALLGTLTGACLPYFLLRHLAGADSARTTFAMWPVGIAFFKYFDWMIFPFRMSVERSTDMPVNHPSAMACAGLVGILGLAALVFRLRKDASDMATGMAWTVIGLVPFCGVILIYQGMAERYEYLASAGFCVSVCSAVFRVRHQARRVVLLSLVTSWTLWGIWRVHNRVLDWTDEARLYSASLRATPASPGLLFNLGAVSERRGELAFAKMCYEKALTYKPDSEPAIAGLGNIYLRLNEPIQARSAYYRALRLKPNDIRAIVNLGIATQEMNDWTSAEQQYKHAIDLAPDLEDAYCDLGALLFQEQRVVEAIRILSKALQLNPNDPTANYDLAAIYQFVGRRDIALEFYRRVLALRPSDPDARSKIIQLESNIDGRR
jgi:tetratricopeptide (TPR) repeat protein